MGPPGSPALLTQMVQQIDDKHENGHSRLRRDFRMIETKLDQLEHAQADTRLLFATFTATGERRKELSGRQALLYASLIAVGGRLLEVILTHWWKP